MRLIKTALIIFFVFSAIQVNTKNTSETEVDKKLINSFLKERKQEKNVDKVLDLIDRQNEYDSLYEVFIKFMKENEGYRKYPYRCLGGKKTVGYGHVIKDSDSLSFPLSQSQADSLLRVDFNKRIEWVEDDLNLDRLQDPYKVLALSHFVFNVGQGNLKSSFMYQKLKNTGQLTKTIHQFVHVKTQTGYVKSNHLKEMRKFEYKMFNKKV